MLEAQRKTALSNWQRKSSYLKAEIEKYCTYIEVLATNSEDLLEEEAERRSSLSGKLLGVAPSSLSVDNIGSVV